MPRRSLHLQKSFFLVVFLSIFFVNPTLFVSASVATPPPLESKAVTVATVNVQDFELLRQEGNVFTLRLNISNREGIQPKIIYAIDLFQKDNKGKEYLVDQKIYDNDVLLLRANDSVYKEITYVAPDYLRGSFTLMAEVRNSDSLIFGTVPLFDAITLNGTNEYIHIEQSSCFLTVDGEKNNKTYRPVSGTDISEEETLIAHCTVINTFKTDQTVTPIFQTRYRSVFGKTASVEKQKPLTLKPGTKTTFAARLPKDLLPQEYETTLTFLNGKSESISSPVAFRHVLRGESAAIQNLTVNKDYFQAKQVARIAFFWTGLTADSFPASRLEIMNPGNNVYFENSVDVGKEFSAIFTMTDNTKNPCAQPFTQGLNTKNQGGVERFSIFVTQDCLNPIFSVKIIGQTGKVLAENTYEIESKDFAQVISAAESKSNLDRIVYVAFFLIATLVAVLFVYLVKKNKRSSIAMLFGLVVGLEMLIGGGHEAKADTFSVPILYFGPGGRGPGWRCCSPLNFSANLNKSVYIAGEPVYAYGSYTFSAGSGLFTAITLANTTIGITATINGGVANINNTWGTFTAPGAAGGYSALISGSAGNVGGPPIHAVFGLPYPSVGVIAIPYTVMPSLVNGSCGASNNSCTSGALSDIPDSPTDYLWNCSGSGGGSSASCSAILPPNLSFSIDSSSITIGVTTVLRWNASGSVTSCNATGNWSGAKTPGVDSEVVGPFASPGIYAYNLSCSGPGGTTVRSQTLTVTLPPPVNGSCGPSNGIPSVKSPPGPTLCGTGTPSAVTKNLILKKWEWTCSGLYGGVDSPLCSADKKPFFRIQNF